jgi:bacillithiol system protein YtxJ
MLLFKHSPICPVSDTALEHWERFRAVRPELPARLVDVVGDRPVARGIAGECGIPHASPQALLFRDGEVVWHASHGAITERSLFEACRQASA